MNVILIPGFWLDSSAWDDIVPAVRATGHTPQPVMLPGLVPADPGVGVRDQADYVVGLVDAVAGPVVLVGHSGGGAVAHAVVDARPDRIAKVIYVDSGPLGDGGLINDGFTAIDGMVPLPPRDEFDEESLVELAAVKHVEIVELRTGHWPMLSKPAELASVIATALPAA